MTDVHALRDAEPLTRVDVTADASPLSFKINNFDFIRLLAATQVVVFHCFHRFGIATPAVLVPFSWFPGVPIFFVMSGFLISGSWERNRDLVEFAISRGLRIFPGLWVCVALTAGILVLFGYPVLGGRGLVWLVAQACGLIYTPAFLSGFGVGSYNGSLWTITIELQFYVMLPVLYWVVARSGLGNRGFVLAFAGFLALGAAIALALPDLATAVESISTKLIRYTFVSRFYLFLLGVLLQRLRVHASPWLRGRGLYWLAGYLALSALLPPGGAYYIVAEIMMGVTVIALAYTLPTLAERLLRGTDLSYGIYLYHGLVINVLFEAGLRTIAAPTWVVLALSIVIASLSWTLVERPALRGKAILRRRFRAFRPGGGSAISGTVA